MKTYAFIPAKSRSRRFPGKNTARFLSSTLLGHAVFKLRNMPQIDRVVISSDLIAATTYAEGDPKIWDLNRPKELLQDDTPTEDVVMHLINRLQEPDDYTIVLSQVTSPLWSAESLGLALTIFNRHDYDSLIAVDPWFRPCGAFYIFRKERFLNDPRIFTQNINLYLLPEDECIDIDYEWQLHIATAIARNRYE